MRSIVFVLAILTVTSVARRQTSNAGYHGAREWDIENMVRHSKGEITDAKLRLLHLKNAMQEASMLKKIIAGLRNPEGMSEPVKIVANPRFQDQAKRIADSMKKVADTRTRKSLETLDTLLLALNAAVAPRSQSRTHLAVRNAPTQRRVPAQPRADAVSDAVYSLSALVVVGLVGRQVFDTIFIENDATVPNKPKLSLPNPFGREEEDPTIEAERIRQSLQAAAEAGDLEGALRLEKELKNFLWDNNIVYEIDVEPERRGLRIEDMEAASGSSVIQSENSAERDQMLRDLE